MNSIFHRTSIRKYQDRPVEPEKITEILHAGMQAPSAVNQQPWEFYVVTNREVIEDLSRVSQYSHCVADAPVVIVPVYKVDGIPVPSMAPLDMAIAQENIWLQTDALGLGGVWIGIAPFEDRMEYVRKVLNLPEGLHPFSLFPLGYPAETRKQQNRFFEERIHYVK